MRTQLVLKLLPPNEKLQPTGHALNVVPASAPLPRGPAAELGVLPGSRAVSAMGCGGVEAAIAAALAGIGG
jgi:hypothetical protein